MAAGSLKDKNQRRPSPELPATVMASTSLTTGTGTGTAAAQRKSYVRRGAVLPSSAVLGLGALIVFYVTAASLASPAPRFYSIDVVNEFPHDPAAFTQGLLYGGNGTLFESTGLYEESSIRKVHLETGKVLQLHEMDGSLFGEGLTLLGERLFQVTWRKTTGFIYDRYNLSELGKFSHQMRDGWGLATDGKIIFGSDGSSTLYQLDPLSFKVIKRNNIRYNSQDVLLLNELEFVSGEVWANIWMTDCIARISPNGEVLGWILLHELRQGLSRSGYNKIDVLNGIAWDEEKNRVFVTGKLWPKLYEIKLREVTGPSNGNIDKLCPLKPDVYDQTY